MARRGLPAGVAAVAVSAALALSGASARAEVELKFSGMISSDIRFRLKGEPQDTPYPSQLQLLRYGFSRNDNVVKAKLSLNVGSKVKAVADADIVFYGYSDVRDLDSLTLRERVDPYRLELHAAYLDVYNLLPHLDLRIGRQVVVWGSADQFSPTNNVNTLDLSDSLLFGRALANNMVRLDYNPKSDWLMTAVWVPIFRPAQLPRTAPIYLRQIDRPAPVQSAEARDFLYVQAQNPSLSPTQINVFTYQPEVSLSNSQMALRLAGRLGGADLSLSYYHGRFGLPVGPVATINHANKVADVAVAWPRMDVLGFDVAGTIEKLGGMGYWIEGAVFFPEQVEFALYDELADGKRTEVRFDEIGAAFPRRFIDEKGTYRDENGNPAAPVGERAIVVPKTPFPKITIGGDISIGSHVYVNMQYVHGFIDEFGSGTQTHALVDAKKACQAPGQAGCEKPRLDNRIGDYFIVGGDVKLFGDALLFRLFAVVKIPSLSVPGFKFDDYKFTGVLFPQLAWTVWDGAELSAGAFIFLGDRSTKFGDPSAGASEMFLKAKFTY
ncbi:MAG: hypothetical protein EXR72_19850 [Myxococcales bacterium]|nr:hypothetical protein [Myxococcales bacterium]